MADKGKGKRYSGYKSGNSKREKPNNDPKEVIDIEDSTDDDISSNYSFRFRF